MTEHTALPWRLHRYIDFGCKHISILSGRGKDTRFVLNLAGERSEEDARFIVTACNCHAKLLKACLNSLGAYEALESLGADKELPGYETCLSFLKQIIHEAEEAHK